MGMLHGVMVAVLLTFPVAAAAQTQARFEPPGETFGAAEAFQLLRQQLERGKPADAAEQAESLLRERVEDLVWLDEGGLISIAALLDLLPTRSRDELMREYRKRFDADAVKVLDPLRSNRAVRAEHLYQVARRYPLSSAAAIAYVEAAGRAALMGDYVSASCLYDLAMRNGGTLDAERESIWAACRQLQAADSGKGGGNELVYRGPLPFAATWYGELDAVGQARYFPYAVGDAIFFVGSRHVIAARGTGQVKWRWTAADAWTRTFSPDRGRDKGHGTPYASSVFIGAAGAQLLLVRQPKPLGPDYCLRAFRAADGKLLWTSESMAAFDRLSLAGNPTVAGRIAYTVAVDFDDVSATLVLLGVDVLNGSVVFKTPLGKLLDMKNQRESPPAWDDFWEQTGPCVSGEAVYLTPNVGVAYCIDRFDGRVRWARIYDDRQGGKVWRDRSRRPSPAQQMTRVTPPANADQLLRWRSTPQVCGNTVVIAPQDSIQAWGLDAASGKLLWANAYPNSGCLIGGTDTQAILVSMNVSGVDSATGRVLWRYEPPSPRQIAGPSVVGGGVVWIPTSDGKIATLSVDKGEAVVATTPPPIVREILGDIGLQKALDEARIFHTFGTALSPKPNP